MDGNHGKDTGGDTKEGTPRKGIERWEQLRDGDTGKDTRWDIPRKS